MYEGLSHLGYKGGGNLLEPALGTGHFYGCIPSVMKPAKLYGVELNSISGRMEKGGVNGKRSDYHDSKSFQLKNPEGA